jgi:hypothetical protein
MTVVVKPLSAQLKSMSPHDAATATRQSMHAVGL